MVHDIFVNKPVKVPTKRITASQGGSIHCMSETDGLKINKRNFIFVFSLSLYAIKIDKIKLIQVS